MDNTSTSAFQPNRIHSVSRIPVGAGPQRILFPWSRTIFLSDRCHTSLDWAVSQPFDDASSGRVLTRHPPPFLAPSTVAANKDRPGGHDVSPGDALLDTLSHVSQAHVVPSDVCTSDVALVPH